ncbi:MAG: 2-C-methyl-D-erythritol 2,4-cyclodiphosphate synthase [Holosporales bacterium]|nr:2-C-methyl-D-erythritol 2,4-cyclodiphosphate synthase [Holosporales bacterium]
MPGIYVVIVAAGMGRRFGASLPKQFCSISGKSVIRRSVDEFLKFKCVTGIICVIPSGFLEEYNKNFHEEHDERLLGPVYGGSSRFESVKHGLDRISEFSPDYVLIHDSVRCFCHSSVIERVINSVKSGFRAVIPTIKSTDSIRFSGKNVDRSQVELVQTPQAFNFNLIHGLYQQYADLSAINDDASICDLAGIQVVSVEGHRSNRKITFKEDIERVTMRTGFGFDVHRFSSDPNRKLYLMGICIDGYPGLEGHSDADVGIHSIVDAILGALGEGSIGEHFPNDSIEWKSADSKIFLQYCRNLLRHNESTIINIDATIVCEDPKIVAYSKLMKRTIAQCLAIRESVVNIKGKSTEGLGFTGQREGIAVYALVSLENGIEAVA